MDRKLLISAAAAGVTLLAAVPAGAGEPGGELMVTPDPAHVGDVVIVGNAPGDANTCDPFEIAEGGAPAVALNSVVEVVVEDPDGQLVVDEVVQASADGNWSVSFTAEKEGTYVANAGCDTPAVPVGAGPQREPGFTYIELEFDVLAQEPTTSTTGGTSSTTGETRADTIARPRFTG